MAMIAIQFCPHSTAGLNEPFITNFLSFGCSWFYLLCNFLISFFWYYLYCTAITFIIIPAAIYIILLPDASSRLLIQPNCTLILMLIFSPPPLSPTRFSQEKLVFSVLPTACTILPCFCWVGQPYFTRETHILFFPLKIFMYKKKNQDDKV